MKTRKQIEEMLADLYYEKNQAFKEFENDNEVGSNRECADSDVGELLGKIKILEWVLGKTRLTKKN